ncbi:MAG: ATP-binding cassette domain-containing protein [Flavobacteriales bacterium]
MLKFSHLNFFYKNKEIFKDVNLNITSNFVFLVGENGSGKTTLLNLIAQVFSFKGEILYNGKNIRKETIFYMESERLFLPKIKGKEYLKYRGTLLGLDLSEEYVTKLGEIFDLPLNLYIENYSTGMKKKIEFIPSLFKKYSIYLFDEPLLGLDYYSSCAIQKTIHNLINDDAIIVVSTHDVEYIKQTTCKTF